MLPNPHIAIALATMAGLSSGFMPQRRRGLRARCVGGLSCCKCNQPTDAAGPGMRMSINGPVCQDCVRTEKQQLQKTKAPPKFISDEFLPS